MSYFSYLYYCLISFDLFHKYFLRDPNAPKQWQEDHDDDRMNQFVCSTAFWPNALLFVAPITIPFLSFSHFPPFRWFRRTCVARSCCFLQQRQASGECKILYVGNHWQSTDFRCLDLNYDSQVSKAIARTLTSRRANEMHDLLLSVRYWISVKWDRCLALCSHKLVHNQCLYSTNRIKVFEAWSILGQWID